MTRSARSGAPAAVGASGKRSAGDSTGAPQVGPGGRGRALSGTGTLAGGVLALGLLAVICGGAYGLGQQRGQRDAAMQSLTRSGYYQGLQLFARDRVDAFPQAREAMLLAAGANLDDPTPLAALAELSARWAEALRAQAVEVLTPALQVRLLDEAEVQGRLSLDYAAEALARRPALPESQRALAAALCAQAGAVRGDEIEKRLRQSPVGAETTYLWALLRARQGRSAEALRLLQWVSVGGEAPVRALLLAATLQVKAGRPEEARRLLLQAQAASPEHAGAQAALSALREAASTEEAVSIASGGLRVAPAGGRRPTGAASPEGRGRPDAGAPRRPGARSLDAQMELAQRLLAHRRAGEAQRLLTQLQQEHDEDPDVHAGLGQAALMLERNAEAQDHFRAALSRRTDYPPALWGLAEAARGRGDLESARDLYQRYLEKSPYGLRAEAAREQLRRLAAFHRSEPRPTPLAEDEPAPPAE